MSDTGFFLLPTNKLYKKENTKRLKNFPTDMLEVFSEIWQIVLTPTIIFLQI